MTHLFFDLDGTLTDSSEGIMRAYAYMMDAMRLPYRDYTDFKRVVGPPLFDCFREDGVPEDQAKEALRLFQEYYAARGIWENEIYEGIKEALFALKESGIRLFVVTAKPEPFAKKVLDHFGLTSFFEDIIGADMAEKHCDKQTLLAEILKRNGISPSPKMAMIGDRSYDMIGALRVGIRAYGVLWGIGSEEELKGAGAERLFERPTSLTSLIDE